MIYSSFFVHNNKGDFMNVLLTGATSGIGYHLALKLIKKEINISKLDIDIKLIEPGTYKTGFNQIMIDSKNELDSSLFNNTMIKTSKMQSKIFSIIEYKKLNSIVNKMYNAIESKSNKLTYRAPLLQIIVLKLYLLFVK